jgi:hypothetical protein
MAMASPVIQRRTGPRSGTSGRCHRRWPGRPRDGLPSPSGPPRGPRGPGGPPRRLHPRDVHVRIEDDGELQDRPEPPRQPGGEGGEGLPAEVVLPAAPRHRLRVLLGEEFGEGPSPGDDAVVDPGDLHAHPAGEHGLFGDPGPVGHLPPGWNSRRVPAISLRRLSTRKFTVPSGYVPSLFRSPAGIPVSTSIPSSMVFTG